MNWLLLRGLARQSQHWGDFPERLAEALPGDRVYLRDLPGTGSRNAQASPKTIPAIREAVQAACDDLPVPLILVGLSLGGMVALDWAIRSPKSIAGVVAINSSSGWSPSWQRLQPRRWGRVLAGLADPDSERREARIWHLTSNNTEQPGVLTHWCQLHKQSPVTRRTALRQIFAAARYHPTSRSPEMPVLLLASRADRLVDPRCSGKLAQLWNCKLVLHDRAGHDLPLDDPEWVLARLMAFRDGLS